MSSGPPYRPIHKAKPSNHILLDWIAHGMMDSIVDSFFPLLEEVEKEMVNLDAAMFSEETAALTPAYADSKPRGVTAQRPSGSDTAISHSSSLEVEKEKLSSPDLSDKIERPSALQTQFILPKRHLFACWHVKDFFRNLVHRLSRKVQVKSTTRSTTSTQSTVHRVARVRRLVTSLSRILATKSEVVAQVKKRLLMTGESGLWSGTHDDHDVFVYLGDVQGTRICYDREAARLIYAMKTIF